MMMNYKKLNDLIGWIVFIIASAVYLLTIEPTASWWDCGEFIATSYKLQIGHPPGAPLFMIMGRIFTLFAFGNTALVAAMVNAMSALMSSASILFLFWSITALTKKLFPSISEPSLTQKIIIFGSALVGSLAYTFSDSFWFSAVEGEVYATSSMFTAFVFWAILKWEAQADKPRADRWIVLIAYMMGLSIGVHLLNLLVIPAIGYIYYFKRYQTSRRGIIYTGLISALVLGLVQYGIVGGLVKIASIFELMFVNGFGMPFHSGLIFFILALAGLTYWLIHWTKKHHKYLLNLITICFTFIILGYASYAMIIIRSGANTPLDENNPEDMFSMLSYLNREQYGNRPLFYGQYYNAKLIDIKNTGAVYKRMNGKYVEVDQKREYVFEEQNCTAFPRMYSNEPQHIEEYKKWADIKGDMKPSFGQNVKFMFKYQIGWMYFRYFMWNFSGRQNNIQGHGGAFEGNWITGIDFLDKAKVGPQENLPRSLKENKGRNAFFMLPLILGLIGMFYHFKKHKKDAWVVMILFFMTGIAIILYLNFPPLQPRERDYAYVGSFYAFAIWIGLGVAALIEGLSKLLKKNPNAVTGILVTTATLALVPGIMAKEGWDDHDRSGKYAAHDFAYNYLNSCAPNAILFTNGDNDTFPLWYLQEVEGIRTDVRVANYTLLGGDWHIHQMYKKAYDSDPLPLTLKAEDYNQGTNDYLQYIDRGITNYISLKEVVNFVANPSDETKMMTQDRQMVHYLPVNKFFIPVDTNKVVKNGTVDPNRYKPVPNIGWELKENGIYKHQFMVYDLLATNDWNRPIYFAAPYSIQDILPLGEYFKTEGFTSRLVPGIAKNPQISNSMNTDIMFDNMVNKFRWGNLNNPNVYLDPESDRMVSLSRSMFARLAQTLISENKINKAIIALDKCFEAFPDKIKPLDIYTIPLIESYYRCGKIDKGNAALNQLADNSKQELDYFVKLLNTHHRNEAFSRVQESISALNAIVKLTKDFKQTQLSMKYEQLLNTYYKNLQMMGQM